MKTACGPKPMRLLITPLLRAAPCASQAAACSSRAQLPFVTPQFGRATADRNVAARAKDPKHAMRSVSDDNVVAEQPADPEIVAFQQHQRGAARLTLAEETRTLMSLAKWGVLSTNGRKGMEGYPNGSVVEYALDAAGRPVICVSALSSHTADLQRDGRCTLVVTAPNFTGLTEARVAVTGEMAPVPQQQKPELQALYKARHPGSFWVEFGDFQWFTMSAIKSARIIAGFGRAGTVTPEEYDAAAPDAIAPLSAPVCGHMNDDHADATAAIVRHYAGITVEKALMEGIDRLGMNVQCTRDGQSFKARIPWVRPAEDRKMVKEVIVEMTHAAAAAASGNGASGNGAPAAKAA